jgi:hypothetical protein
VPSEDAEEPRPVTLIDASGRERKFNLHDAFELEGVSYYLVEAAENPTEVLLLREVEGVLETVEDDEFQRVMKALDEDEVE